MIRLHAAARRPLPVPARRGAGVLRARDDLPHRRRPGARSRPSGSWSGWGCSRRRSSACATSACSSATATRSRWRALLLLLLPRVPGIGQQVNGAYLGVEDRARSPSSRRSSRRSRSSSSSPPTCATPARCSCRASRRILGRDDPAAQAPRAAARGLGRGDVDARVHPRPRLVADVLRRLPGAALRRHQPVLVRGHRAWPCSRSAPGSSPHGRPRAGPRRRSGWIRSTRTWVDRRGLPDRQSVFAQADGGLFGTGFGASLLRGPGGDDADPAPPHTDLIYAVIINELGLVGRLRADPRLPAVRRARLQDRHGRRATRSPSCWPPA